MPQFVVIATNTTVSSITMECIVPPELVLSELGPDTWEWDKLAAGIQMFNQPLPLMSNVSTTGEFISLNRSVCRLVLGSVHMMNLIYKYPMQTFYKELSNTSYLLSVSCSQSGFYQAIYRGQDGSCVYRCSFFVEVEEIRESVLRNVFSVYRKLHFTVLLMLHFTLALVITTLTGVLSLHNINTVLLLSCAS